MNQAAPSTLSTRTWAPIFFLPAIFYMGFIFYLSGRPSHPSLHQWPLFYGIKLVHLLEYGFLAVLWIIAFYRGSPLSPSVLRIAAWCIVVLWGVSDEIHQSFIPERTAHVVDVVADAIASALIIGVDILRHRFTSGTAKAETP